MAIKWSPTFMVNIGWTTKLIKNVIYFLCSRLKFTSNKEKEKKIAKINAA